MKVLHVNAGNLFGGIETMLLTIARHAAAFPKMESHFSVCFPGQFSSELTSAKARVHILPGVRVSRPWTIFPARTALRRLIEKEQFDAVVTHGSWPHAIFGPIVKQLSIPLLQWVHGLPAKPGWLEKWAGTTDPDHLIVNSQFMQREAVKVFSRVPGEVLYCPAQLSSLSESEKRAARQMLRSQQASLPESVVILQVSRLEALKGQRTHIEALSRIQTDKPWECWFVGGPQNPVEKAYLESLRKLVREKGLENRVRFLGARRDIPQLLAAADIFCQPNSSPESFGLVFVEALAASLPCVSTAIGGVPEILTPDCGHLVAPEDPQALGNILQEWIEKPALREQLSQAGPPRALELCTPEKQIALLEHRIASLLTV